MSKVGAHVVQGSRQNYGDFCTSKPAVVLSVNDGGALLEAKQNSGGHTYTIFRDTTVYTEAPPGINEGDEAHARALGDAYWPLLRDKWAQNPADYYTITNEQGGNDVASYRRIVAYERRICELANDAGFKCIVLNCAGGSPGSINMWTAECLPWILEAWSLGGNIYGRHAYGGDLVPGDGNNDRPMEEHEELTSHGYGGGMVITECGFNGGYGYVGDSHFINQAAAYDSILIGYPLIIGFCLWTLGNWNDANFETALPGLINYNYNNPTPKWQPGNPPPPPNNPPPPDRTELENIIWADSITTQALSLNPGAALQKAINMDGYQIVGNEITVQYNGIWYVYQPAEILTHQARRVYYCIHGDWGNINVIHE